jgi:hypothetical protein
VGDCGGVVIVEAGRREGSCRCILGRGLVVT